VLWKRGLGWFRLEWDILGESDDCSFRNDTDGSDRYYTL